MNLGPHAKWLQTDVNAKRMLLLNEVRILSLPVVEPQCSCARCPPFVAARRWSGWRGRRGAAAGEAACPMPSWLYHRQYHINIEYCMLLDAQSNSIRYLKYISELRFKYNNNKTCLDHKAGFPYVGYVTRACNADAYCTIVQFSYAKFVLFNTLLLD